MKLDRLLWIMIIISSCRSDKNKNQEWKKEFDKDGNLIKEYLINNAGKKEGTYKEFYTNRQLKLLFNYMNDTLFGEQRAFYEDGELQTVGYYSRYGLDSTQKWYYPTG